METGTGQATSGLRPPGAQPPGPGPGPGRGKTAKNGLIWWGLSVVIMLGLAVVLVLPKMVSGPDEVNISTEVPQPATRETANSRNDAAQALQDFLHSRARLELANAPVWGEPEWSQALDGAARGDNLFGQRKFSMAREVFTESLDLLLLLESESGQRLENALNSAWQALETDDSVSAVTFFEIALSIETDNENAIEGLQRASVRPRILELMADARTARSMNDLPRAQVVYLQAVDLDGSYGPAQIALQDVTEQLTELAFNDAMSRALSALDAEQVNTAEVALQQADSLKPGEEVVRNTQHQLAQLRQKLWLTSQRQEALAKERNEDWSEAVLIYRKVLARVTQAAFARQRLEKAEDRERLHQQLDHYLADPSRVYSAQPRTNAEKLIASAGEPPVDETRLAEKINRLESIIIEAQIPLTVTLNSDGMTSVVIHHIGRLGSFISQQLELPPGTYTVVGSRPGYRDVRQTLTVKPGSDQPALDIRCEESV